MQCSDDGSIAASIQTQPMRSPDGTVAALKVSSADDHSIESHDCMADYQLLIKRSADDAPAVLDILSSDAEYGRNLSLRLNGFSHDGKRVYGTLSEDGKHPSTNLFEYDIADSKLQLFDLKEQFARIVAENCPTTFDVVGNTEKGAIVLELNSTNGCAPRGRWLLTSANSRVQPLPHGASIVILYEFKPNTP
ncbi:MAG: hypothetical protein WBL63_13870 [Candidatus Acidiferrum sp.]